MVQLAGDLVSSQLGEGEVFPKATRNGMIVHCLSAGAPRYQMPMKMLADAVGLGARCTMAPFFNLESRFPIK
jgi:hypothetical protein